MKCFYHSADLDGKCSGAIVKHRFPGCKMIGINYGDQFPWEKIEPLEEVFMVDFSLQPFDDMERLNELSYLHWIDHHKTAMEEAYERGFLARGGQSLEDGTAACELVWDYIYHGKTMPRAVFLLGRYDVWDHHNHEGALEFQYGMRNEVDTMPESSLWPCLFDENDCDSHGPLGPVQNTIGIGETILDYQRKQDAIYARACSFETKLDGLHCIAINKGLTNSLVFDSVWDREKYDAMLSFVYRKGQWTISLYSDKPEVDVSTICKARGGGGHKGAAGFQCERLPFIWG